MTSIRFGALLRTIRKSQGKTLKEVASVAECSIVYISDVERGGRPPLSGPKLEAVATFLGAPQLIPLAYEERGAVDMSGLTPAECAKVLALVSELRDARAA